MDEEYRSIGEVADALDLPQHVLRFWETRFKEIAPLKRAGGRRLYRAGDVELVAAIKRMLYDEGYTIKGVQRLLKERGVEGFLQDQRAPDSMAAPAPAPLRQEHLRQEHLRQEPAFAPPVFPAVVEERRAADPPPPEPISAPTPVALQAPAVAAPSRERLLAALEELDECRRLLLLAGQ